MEPREYTAMRAVEDRHWWFQSLRALSNQMLKAHALTEGNMLDVGCGTGGWLSTAPPGLRKTGVDFNPLAIELFAARGVAPVARATAMALPFSDETFDVVTCLDVLYHRAVVDDAAAAQELARVLKPGGVLLITLPAYKWLWSSHDTHVHSERRYLRGEVIKLIEGAGCSCLRATYWNTLLFPLAVAARVAGKLRPSNEASDVSAVPAPINGAFKVALGVERALIKAVPMPFGLSIMGVGKKPARR